MGYCACVPKLRRELRRILSDAMLDLGTQAQVAKLLKVDQATVSRWLSGRQGMDVGQCLRFAKLTNTPLVEVLEWAGFDPLDYLDESSKIPSLPADAKAIQDRVRLLSWERRRAALPEKLRPLADRAIDSVLKTHEEAATLSNS